MNYRNSEEGNASPPGGLLDKSIPNRLFEDIFNSLRV
jgi:hypothetical protein